MRRKNWSIKPLHPQAQELGKKYSFSPFLAQVMLNRDIAEEGFFSFLDPDTKYLHDPLLLPDMPEAAAAIKKVLKAGKKIFLFGDYDVDGITSLAVFNEFAKDYPDQFSFYIPRRVDDGYGLNAEGIRKAAAWGAALVLAFDCGTNSSQEIALARSLGMDTVVVDHHLVEPGFQGPLAFVNPKRPDSLYPFSELSGAALSFKLLQVLTGQECFEALDLVALSLVCDVVPLLGENRVLLKEGLNRIRASRRPAIRALCQVARVNQANLNTFHLGYVLGPRINASGRVACASEALEMFLTQDIQEAQAIAVRLQDYNQQRKTIEAEILAQAYAKAESAGPEAAAIIVEHEGWHPGVLGIVASRLADKYYRPSFAISFQDQVGRGSGRSIHSVHLVEILKECSQHLQAFGGHRRAAGLQIDRGDLEAFKEKIDRVIKERVKPEDFVPLLSVDAQIHFDDIDLGLVEGLAGLEPFGEENPKPLFATYSAVKKSRPQKIKTAHTVWLSCRGRTLEANVYDKDLLDIIEYGDSLDIVYSLDKNSYHNIPKLNIKDARLAGSGS